MSGEAGVKGEGRKGEVDGGKRRRDGWSQQPSRI